MPKRQKGIYQAYIIWFFKKAIQKKNTWEPSSTIMHLWKMISTFHKNYPEKPIVTYSLLYSTPPMAKPSVKPVKSSTKQK